MNPIDISLTESVQGAGGAGFSAPIFRAGGGIDQGNATPQARGGQGMDYLAGIADIQGLDPVSSLRDAFDQEVTNTYEWIAGVVEKGYDPTKMDMSDPNSKKVYLELMQRKQGLKKMADDLKLSGRMKEKGNLLVDPTADATTIMNKGIESNLLDIAKGLSQTFTQSGYDNKEAFGMAMEQYQMNQEGLFRAYINQRDLLKDSPTQQRKLDAMYEESKAMLRMPTFSGGMNEYERAKLAIDRENIDFRKQVQLDKELNDGTIDEVVDVVELFNPESGDGFRYSKTRLSVPPVDVTSARGFALSDGKLVKTDLNGIKIDSYQTLPIDKNGNPMAAGSRVKLSDVVGFKTFAVGNAKVGDNFTSVYIDPELTRNKHKGKVSKLVSDRIDVYKTRDQQLKSEKINRNNANQAPAATQPSAPQRVTNANLSGGTVR